MHSRRTNPKQHEPANVPFDCSSLNVGERKGGKKEKYESKEGKGEWKGREEGERKEANGRKRREEGRGEEREEGRKEKEGLNEEKREG